MLEHTEEQQALLEMIKDLIDEILVDINDHGYKALMAEIATEIKELEVYDDVS